MVLKYNVKGEKRKQLVGTISKELGKPTKYLGAPTFSYEVGDYTIDQCGTLTGPDSLDLEDALHQTGFDAGEREYDEPETYESGLGGMGAVDEIIGNLTIEMPYTGFTDVAIDNLKKLVASKSALIKKALGTDDLPIIVTDNKISFPWFRFEHNPNEIAAYTHFISALCDMAKSQKRVNAKETATDNEKFAFRTFLLRLGFIEPEFKEYRKLLLKNLSGSSAFRNGGSDDV